MTDADITKAAVEDPDASIVPRSWWKRARLVPPPEKKHQITIKVDGDVLAFFRRPGRGYQTRMNAVLRAYMESARGR